MAQPSRPQLPQERCLFVTDRQQQSRKARAGFPDLSTDRERKACWPRRKHIQGGPSRQDFKVRRDDCIHRT